MPKENIIKLVIWDLDDTFWRGTLSEEEVVLIPENIQIIRTLSQRGIVNSICSKNDEQMALQKLQESGIAGLLVFPHISWNAKGEQVKHIINQCQLRPANVLFIDDNPINLREVEFYNPGIQTMDAKDIPKLLDDPRTAGSDDSGLTRLKQYKILEKKAEFQSHCSDNRDFLLKSDIRVKIIRDTQSLEGRIIELANRSNQLNYTKLRIQDGQHLPSGKDWDTAAIHVADNFGDYGICGYYALNKQTNTLLHFFFSCRALHLGVENFIYQLIGCPTIEVVGEVAAPLNANEVIDWIRIDDSVSGQEDTSAKKAKKRIMLIGGCDLDLLHHYIDKTRFDVICDFNHMNKRNHEIIHNHTRYLELGTRWNEQIAEEYRAISWWDDEMMDYPCLKQSADIVVYSTLQNIWEHQFLSKTTGNFLMASKDVLLKDKIPLYTEEDIRYIREKYEYVGWESEDELQKQLDELQRIIPAKKFIFLNIAEIPDAPGGGPDTLLHYQKMNSAIENYVKRHSATCSLVDVRKFVRTRHDITDTISHYRRMTYVQLAEEVMSNCGIEVRHNEMRNQIESLFKHTAVKLWLKTGGIRRKTVNALSSLRKNK